MEPRQLGTAEALKLVSASRQVSEMELKLLLGQEQVGRLQRDLETAREYLSATLQALDLPSEGKWVLDGEGILSVETT